MSYASPAAFRTALETRLNAAAQAGGPPIGRARKVVAFTRLLARLCHSAPDGWVLKGGFALELRLAGRSRATRDVDLDFAAGLDAATEALAAAAADLGDFFEFAVERVGAADVGLPAAGFAFAPRPESPAADSRPWPSMSELAPASDLRGTSFRSPTSLASPASARRGSPPRRLSDTSRRSCTH